MKPLEGVRVLTFEQFGAGPYGSMLLADLGAEVIKVENAATGGDAARHVGPHMLANGDSQYFQTWNMNKKSVALDIKTAEGRAGFEQLVTTADAVMNNLRGDQPEKLGLDYASLKHINPKIVCLHISAYGRDNERKSWPGYDFLMQAEAGVMGLTGEPDGPPTRVGASMVDFMTGATGATGLLACILRAQKTGAGCDVDTCLFDVAMHQLSYAAIWYLNAGEASRRQPRSAHLAVAPVQTFPTADGWIFIMCMTDKFWEQLRAMRSAGRTSRRTRASRRGAAPAEPRCAHRDSRRRIAQAPDARMDRGVCRPAAGRAGVRDGRGARCRLSAPRPEWCATCRRRTARIFACSATRSRSTASGRSRSRAPVLGADNDALLGSARPARRR